MENKYFVMNQATLAVFGPMTFKESVKWVGKGRNGQITPIVAI